jgi:hypothetical protein
MSWPAIKAALPPADIYDTFPSMKRPLSPSPKPRRAESRSLVLGRTRFARISAVEGISLTPAMRRRATEFDDAKLSPEERIRRIIAAHREN